ncbi:hypothetical protein [Tessaracoccus sp. MC1627]|uniref:hypothetical protein n=1 Tax=Tessaracoccus sp. MC1627 TaxID=2760312 RepID=UPI0016041EEF|nr:hypothetical protein [Tessaracoccus sp. MC1627]MBB1514083.1 hypothetical protein [Tessaracoccus sp. MC1627]
MELIHDVLVLLHFVGFAALFGGAFVQVKGPSRAVNAAMVHGVLTQLVTGLLLVGLAEMGDGEVNHLKVGIKLAVVVVIAVFVFMNRKKETLSDGQFWGILGLTLLNVVVAVFV